MLIGGDPGHFTKKALIAVNDIVFLEALQEDLARVLSHRLARLGRHLSIETNSPLPLARARGDTIE